MSDKLSFEFRKCPVVGGKAYASMDEAKREFLQSLFVDENTEGAKEDLWDSGEIAIRILERAQEILAVLTLGEKSRPSTRKALGAVRKPKPKQKREITYRLSELGSKIVQNTQADTP